MRLLLIHQYFLEKEDSGGSRFNEFVKYWAEKGHHITVVAGMVHYTTGKKADKYNGKYFKTEQYCEHVEVIRTHVSEAYNKSFLGRLWGYFSFVFSSVWAGVFMAKGKYDGVLVTSPPLFVGITGYILKLFKRCPLFFEIRDLWPESAIDTGVLTSKPIIKFAYWFESFIYKKSRLINTLTPAFKTKLIDEKGIDANKVLMIPNAADFSLSEELLADFDAANFRKKLGWGDELILTYVGAHGVANHLIQLVEAAERVKDLPVRFVLIGSGMQKQMLVDQAKSRNLTNIEFINSVPKKEVFKYILASDMGMSVLKKVDTFKTIYSNKTFDYMSCKKPVFLAIDGVSRKLVEEAEAGIFVDPENIDEYERKIKWLLKNKECLQVWGENGFQYAKKYFDRKVLADLYINELQKNV